MKYSTTRLGVVADPDGRTCTDPRPSIFDKLFPQPSYPILYPMGGGGRPYIPA